MICETLLMSFYYVNLFLYKTVVLSISYHTNSKNN